MFQILIIKIFNIIQYQKQKRKLGSLDDADPELLRTFEKLGVSLNEQKLLANVAVDAVFDSVSIGTHLKSNYKKQVLYFVLLQKP